jgi:hypothetical protein
VAGAAPKSAVEPEFRRPNGVSGSLQNDASDCARLPNMLRALALTRRGDTTRPCSVAQPNGFG